jgi:hypothetical protein
MAIVINHNPADYSSIHGDLIFTVYEATKAIDPVTYPNYKYVCDVYVGGVLEKRLTTFPRPDNSRGVFNIGPIVRNYLSQQLQPNDQVNCQEFGDAEFYLDVTCKFGEEYAYTTYTNLTVDSSRRYYNTYENRNTGGNPVLTSKTNLPATNRPYENYIRLDTPFFFVPYFTPDEPNPYIQVKVFDNGGALLSDASTTLTVDVDNLIQFNLSPAAILETLALDIAADTDAIYYTVQLGGVSDGTPTFKFNIKDECLYTPYTIHFLNQYGGFDSFDFRKVSRKLWDVEKKSFTQNPYRIGSTGGLAYGVGAPLGIVGYESKTVYASGFREKMKLSADNLTDAEWAWLKELQFSPLVYLQEGDNIIPVTVEGTQYEEKKYVNDKLQSLQIDIDFGVQLNAQFR